MNLVCNIKDKYSLYIRVAINICTLPAGKWLFSPKHRKFNHVFVGRCQTL